MLQQDKLMQLQQELFILQNNVSPQNLDKLTRNIK